MNAVAPRTAVSLAVLMIMSVTLSTIGACHRTERVDDAAEVGHAAATSGAHPGEERAPAGREIDATEDTLGGLHLKPDEVEKLGVVTETLQSTRHAPEASGFAVVVAHETIAQLVADLRTAAAVVRQSKATYERGRRLAGTPGAMPLETLETSERQSTVDQVALDLARQRLSSAYGQQAPWHGNDAHPLLRALATGEVNLVRVTFSVSLLTDTVPSGVRLGRIGAGRTAQTWDSFALWSAPADGTVPGRSFFAVVKNHRFGEGERLLAWTPVTKTREGVFVPATAAVIANGRYWCYINQADGIYVRTEFDPSVPISGGYFVTRGTHAGDKVVTKAAGQLLARELNPGTEAE